MEVFESKRILVAGATGYLGKHVVQAFKARGCWVRVLTRNSDRLFEPGPFTAPALTSDDVDEVFVGEITKPETLSGLLDDIDIVFSCVGISRQRDGLSFDDVDYRCNQTLIDLAVAAGVERFVYVSMQGAENLGQLAITQAHEKVVDALRNSTLVHRIIRPCGYFSDMGAIYEMARKGRVYLVGQGENYVNPIHGRDLAEVCVQTAEGDVVEVVAGGPDTMTQRQAAELAFEVAGRPAKTTVIPLWAARFLVRLLRLLSKQYGDLVDFIVTAGEFDSVGPKRGTRTLRSYFEALRDGDFDPPGSAQKRD
ncbi:MAG: SDR family oxidoreductase [Deltaproteobacteria bacterium]|nr:SDR family oxidoreductase [Deltaproteobacteria bacterium]